MVTESTTVGGIIIPNQVEEEREYECKQLAVAFDGVRITERELNEKLKQLSEGIRQSMIEKGLVI